MLPTRTAGLYLATGLAGSGRVSFSSWTRISGDGMTTSFADSGSRADTALLSGLHGARSSSHWKNRGRNEKPNQRPLMGGGPDAALSTQPAPSPIARASVITAATRMAARGNL